MMQQIGCNIPVWTRVPDAVKDQEQTSLCCSSGFAVTVAQCCLDYMIVLSRQCFTVSKVSLQQSVVRNIQGQWPIAEWQLFYRLLAMTYSLSLTV